MGNVLFDSPGGGGGGLEFLRKISPSSKVCSFGIGTLSLQKKPKKLFWKCIFALLNWKRKINTGGINIYCFSHVGYSITNRNEIEQVANDRPF